MTAERVAGSFRDPAGWVFRREGVLYRQVNRVHADSYDALMSSGLYERLVAAGHLVAHVEVDVDPLDARRVHRVIRPEPVRFVSYPYEWCVSQLREAASLTLDVQRTALEHGMWLRDASAFNVQFDRGRPVLIDTLSFEAVRPGEPWPAYRQFCQHFLAPLAVATYVDPRLLRLTRVHVDGLPLDLAASLLPARTRVRPGLGLHLHQHGKRAAAVGGAGERRAASREGRAASRGVSGRALLGFVESLAKTVRKLPRSRAASTWLDYDEAGASYADRSREHKERIVREVVTEVRPDTVWDLGANVGTLSRIAAGTGAFVVSMDADLACVEENHRRLREDGERNVLPLVMDLTNPSPFLGWDNRERDALSRRGPADLVLALALIHHLVIGNNVPLPDLARSFARLGTALLVEFVPKDDPRVRDLLAVRDDIFDDYTVDGFERAFGECFRIDRRETVHGSGRVLYVMRRREGP